MKILLLGLLAISTAINGDEDLSIRLRGGSSPWEGRVEVYHDGEWGTVCDDQWGMSEAAVVCNQLGYPLATTADRLLRFGKGSGPIWMDNVACSGDEDSLEECNRNAWGDHDCSHSEDAGVICSEDEEGAVRLLGSSSRFEGRVEVMYRGNWGTVCDHGWSDNDADVVCRQLGYQKAKTAVTNAYRYFGYATSPYILEDLRCDGYEDTLLDCVPYDDTPEGCDIYDVAGVFCHGSADDGLSPEATAGIVIGCLVMVGILLCCVIGVISAKSKKKRATTARQDMRADQMVYHVSNTGAASVSGFPQGPYGQPGQYPAPAPGQYPAPAPAPAYYMSPTMDAPPAYEVAGSGSMGATGTTQTTQGQTEEHIYKEAM
ncbi:neurotrypsin-like [Amphiura filiformis]|uniref:neurotrypsin-like n=1 Tax=Amphiura filiformis TaxID=82378 RepID=UPI003B221E59